VSRPPIIQPEQSYTFSDYFKLNFAPQDIPAYFDVSLQRCSLQLPHYLGHLDQLTDLKLCIEESLPRLILTSEMARREFLIAPVLTDIQDLDLYRVPADLDDLLRILISILSIDN
jgi:hypothetical protein